MALLAPREVLRGGPRPGDGSLVGPIDSERKRCTWWGRCLVARNAVCGQPGPPWRWRRGHVPLGRGNLTLARRARLSGPAATRRVSGSSYSRVGLAAICSAGASTNRIPSGVGSRSTSCTFDCGCSPFGVFSLQSLEQLYVRQLHSSCARSSGSTMQPTTQFYIPQISLSSQTPISGTIWHGPIWAMTHMR